MISTIIIFQWIGRENMTDKKFMNQVTGKVKENAIDGSICLVI